MSVCGAFFTSDEPRRSASAFTIHLVLLLHVCACGRGGRAPAEGELRTRVALYCHQLTLDLQRAAEEYTNDAPHLDEMREDQRQRVESMLDANSISVSVDARRMKLRDLQQRMDFCVVTRKLDTKQISDLQVRVNELIEELGPKVVDGQLPPHEAATKSLSDLALLAAEIDSLPLLD